MKTKKPDAAEQIGTQIRELWVGKGCVMHSDSLAEYATKRIRRAIRAAEKRGALAERERIERYIKERRISSQNRVVGTTCADILTDIDHGARPARKARSATTKP